MLCLRGSQPSRRKLSFVAALLCYILTPLSAPAQNFSGGFNFVLPPFDTASHPFLPFFPARPIGNGDAVTIGLDGHFMVAGQAIRFFGVNIVADAAFPPKEQAGLIAGRLRKLGINLVRLHHLDNPWSQNSLFEWGSDTRHLNPVTLDRLENFLAALRENGIYVDINLHVSRTVKVQDGIPDADSIRDFGKGVSFFDPQLLSLHKEYARQLLTHLNPYTGLTLVHEPSMAMVEITNENSLYRIWREEGLKPFAAGGKLTVRHTRLLDSLWTVYLGTAYGTTAALAAAWAADGSGQVGGLLAGESLEDTSVRRIDFAECAGFSDQRVRDMTSFYIHLQKSYYDQMYSYLKDTLGVAVPIAGTALNFGLPDMAVQSRLDYMDNHSYWDHPNGFGIDYTATEWAILNQSMVPRYEGGTIGMLMSGTGVKGKPYTISEYNHCFPNKYQSEGVLLITAYSAFQDADAVMFYDYNSGSDWQSDLIQGFYDIHRNSAMMSLMPSCAWAFRNNNISRARQTLFLRSTSTDVLAQPKSDPGGWLGPSLIPWTLSLQHGIRTESLTAEVSNIASLPPAPTPPFITDTGEITWDPAGVVCVNSPEFIGATGFLANFPGKTIGDLTLVAASDFATFTWIPLTDSVLSRASRSLLTLSSKAQNTGMVWDDTTTVLDQWGSAPTSIYPVEILTNLRINADSLVVYPLSPTGSEADAGVKYLPSAPNIFTVSFSGSSDHTLWFGIEAFGRGTAEGVESKIGQHPGSFNLEQNYPNPFNPVTTIKYTVGENGAWGVGNGGDAGTRGSGLGARKTMLVVYDVLGRQVATLVDEEKAPGSYEVRFDGSGLAGGVYFYRLTAGSFVKSRKMVLLK